MDDDKKTFKAWLGEKVKKQVEKVKDGIEIAVELRQEFLATSIGKQLGASWEQGIVELSNAVYNANGPICVPLVVSQSQIQAEHERDLNRLEEQAQQQPVQQHDAVQQL
jgi:hypothetical protein